MEHKMNRQMIIGIVNMVFDLFEQEDKVPNTYDFYKAIFNWVEYGKCPNKQNLIDEAISPYESDSK